MYNKIPELIATNGKENIVWFSDNPKCLNLSVSSQYIKDGLITSNKQIIKM